MHRKNSYIRISKAEHLILVTNYFKGTVQTTCRLSNVVYLNADVSKYYACDNLVTLNLTSVLN